MKAQVCCSLNQTRGLPVELYQDLIRGHSGEDTKKPGISLEYESATQLGQVLKRLLPLVLFFDRPQSSSEHLYREAWCATVRTRVSGSTYVPYSRHLEYRLKSIVGVLQREAASP